MYMRKSTIYANVNKLLLAFMITVRTWHILVELSNVFESHIWLYITYRGKRKVIYLLEEIHFVTHMIDTITEEKRGAVGRKLIQFTYLKKIPQQPTNSTNSNDNYDWG